MEKYSFSKLKNPILKSFLDNPDNKLLFDNYLKFPTKESKISLEKAFNMHYLKVRLITYFSKTLHFAALRYDQKQRQMNHRNAIILDQPINENNDTLSTILPDSKTEDENKEIVESYEQLENYFADDSVSTAVAKLNLRQKKVLYLAYVMQYKDKEIAKMLGMTIQAVNKNRNTALKKVRILLNG